ncbi:MAG: DUF4361 domain-containing protein [Tannerella sp.]|nr:DUF4361 domain-containing protein [Tannerella sp.]
MTVTIIASFVSCNEYEMFEAEQYKNVFAVVSEDGYNVFQVEHDLEIPESTGYVSFSCGGTNSTEKDIVVSMTPDLTAFDKYNEGNFGSTKEKFAKLMSGDMYDINSYTFTIQKGEHSGRLPILVRPEGLSPDSVYMIPLKVNNFTEYEVNPEKNNVLYQVLIKNKYAAQKNLTSYNFVGYRDGQLVMGVKTMHPLTKNRVRIMVGQEAFQADLATINSKAIVLEVQDDNSVKLLPYRAGGMTVEQLDGDPDFPNIFKIENDGYRTYKTFLLHYKYGGGTEMKEELRLETKENE